MNVIGKLVKLRAIEKSDLELFHKWGNDPELWRMLGGWHFPSSLESTEKWIQKQLLDSQNLRLAITHDNGKLIGSANLLEIDWKNKNAFHGMMLGDSSVRGKGIGQDVVMTIMRYAFEELGLQRLDGSMIEYNLASLKLYCEKCGWKIEGRQRRWYYREGKFWDRIMVGITAQDYHEIAKQSGYWGN